MKRIIHNPWSWQDQLGFVQANEVIGADRTLYCAGQTAVDADGAPQHADDMAKQMELAVDNLTAVLAAAGMTLADVVRITAYVTDRDAFFEHFGVIAERLGVEGCRYAASVVEVRRLALPGLVVELEATAVAGA